MKHSLAINRELTLPDMQRPTITGTKSIVPLVELRNNCHISLIGGNIRTYGMLQDHK
jgi:hypothetical protein